MKMIAGGTIANVRATNCVSIGTSPLRLKIATVTDHNDFSFSTMYGQKKSAHVAFTVKIAIVASTGLLIGTTIRVKIDIPLPPSSWQSIFVR